jgi:hypothetical protein
MNVLAQRTGSKGVDVLTERLTFERAGVMLYDKVMERVRSSREPAIHRQDAAAAEGAPRSGDTRSGSNSRFVDWAAAPAAARRSHGSSRR